MGFFIASQIGKYEELLAFLFCICMHAQYRFGQLQAAEDCAARNDQRANAAERRNQALIERVCICYIVDFCDHVCSLHMQKLCTACPAPF